MRKSRRKKAYPNVDTWNYIPIKEFLTIPSHHQFPTNLSRIEGYCMLNTDYSMCKDRYDFELKSNGTLKRERNVSYDPKKKPDPYPEGCPRSIRSICISCRHFAWCEPDDDITLVKNCDDFHHAV
jgi:hypothetical protein